MPMAARAPTAPRYRHPRGILERLGRAGGRGELDEVAVRVADIGHVLTPRLRLRRRDRLGALGDGPVERALNVVRHEADLEGRARAAALLGRVYGRQVGGRELVSGQRQGGLARVELGVLAALMDETAPLRQRALVEVQAGGDVGDVEDRVTEPHRPTLIGT